MSLSLWHSSPDTPRVPRRVSAGERALVQLGTWPVGPGQSVWLRVERGEGALRTEQRIVACWQRNEGANSYWSASLGPFTEGERIRYTPYASVGGQESQGPPAEFRVGPKIHLSLLWHYHQPDYVLATPRSAPPGKLLKQLATPWVRLHALRDYYSMAALVAEYPELHITFNFTPSLLAQLEAYVSRSATDRALDLTLRDAASLCASERGELVATFFDADWHHQIFAHARYRELFELRATGQTLSLQELRDLQMWFNLAWFGVEFRTGQVQLATGETCSVRRFVEQSSGFSSRDIAAMVEEQRRILRAILPLHSTLQERGQIEVSATPFYHPILPLLLDTDDATVDRPAAALPPRFAWPADAAEQVVSACRAYRNWFGRSPRGMWPAEGAVSQSSIPLFAEAGVAWIATDRGVLAGSGRWGYEAHRPDVLCQPRRAAGGEQSVAVFFRDTQLSDAIGFGYSAYADPEIAAEDFVEQVRARFVRGFEGQEDRILSVILDGENAWGSYADDGRPFLRALYRKLAELQAEIRTVTFAEWLEGNASRGVGVHAAGSLEPVFDLFTGSWIDEVGSAPGVDLGTWIGEAEENRAWRLLGETRQWLAAQRATPSSAPEAFAALYAAEGSDWFWWYGSDQESVDDGVFDQIFRGHLRSVYEALGTEPPPALRLPIVLAPVLWTFTNPIAQLPAGARLALRTACPGLVRWKVDEGPWCEHPVHPVGGVMAGASFHQLTLGPFSPEARRLNFEFECRHAGCSGQGLCCRLGVRSVQLDALEPTNR